MAKTTSWVFGIIFLIVGIWGFFTSSVLGFIASNPVSSIVHIIVGIVLLIMAAKPAAVVTLKTVGIIYVVIAILGFLSLNILGADMATNWFYLIVGVVVAALGWSSKGSSSSSPAPQM